MQHRCSWSICHRPGVQRPWATLQSSWGGQDAGSGGRALLTGQSPTSWPPGISVFLRVSHSPGARTLIQLPLVLASCVSGCHGPGGFPRWEDPNTEPLPPRQPSWSRVFLSPASKPLPIRAASCPWGLAWRLEGDTGNASFLPRTAPAASAGAGRGARVRRAVFPASPVPSLRPPRTLTLHTWYALPGGLRPEDSGLLLSS